MKYVIWKVSDGSRDTFRYDIMGQLIYQETRDGTYQEAFYDAAGNMVFHDDNGIQTYYGYDLLGRNIWETTAGATTWYTYDACGRLTEKMDQDGNTTQYGYDRMGNVTSCIEPDGTYTGMVYDENGRLIKKTDALGNETTYGYDTADRLTAVTDALGNTVSYEYDGHDNISVITDALGNRTSYGYDAAGQVISETDALGNTWRYSYTAEGWLAGKTDPQGQETAYTYDRTGNLTGVSYPDGTEDTYTYDVMGKLCSSESAGGVVKYSYDDRNNLSSVTWPSGRTTGYEYDDKGQMTAIVYPDGTRAEYAYDELGRMVSVSDGKGGMVSYAYDRNGRRIRTSGNGTTTTYAYDASGRITDLNTYGGTSLLLHYTYDGNGNLLTEERTDSSGTQTAVYGYDALGRLTGWERSDGSLERYTYDAAGNMTAKETADQTVEMVYDAAGRMISMHDGSGETTYGYDASGNLLTAARDGRTESWTYDAAGRPVSYRGMDGQQASYRYSAQGFLLEKAVPGGETVSYVYNLLSENTQVLARYGREGKEDYLYGMERIAAYGEDTRTDYFYDVRGSVAAAVRTGEETVTETFAYTPYGEQTTPGNSVEGDRFGYNGEMYDAVSGTYCMRARRYDPSMMRFMQKDLRGGNVFEARSLNGYLYCMDDPVTYADPDGEFPLPAILGLAAAAGPVATAVYEQAVKPVMRQVHENYILAQYNKYKTTQAVINVIKASTTFRAFVAQLKKMPVGRILVDMGGRLVQAATHKQAEAVWKAYRLYARIHGADNREAENLNRQMAEFCREYMGVEVNEDKGETPIEAVRHLMEDPDRLVDNPNVYRLLNAQQQTEVDGYRSGLELLEKLGIDTPENREGLRQYTITAINNNEEYQYTPRNINNYPYKNWTLDQFWEGNAGFLGRIAFGEATVIDGVVIPANEEGYTKEELRKLINAAKSKGKKADWEYVDGNSFDERMGIHETKAGYVLVRVAVGGVVIAGIVVAAPGAAALGGAVTLELGLGAAVGETVVATGAAVMGVTELLTTAGDVQEIITGKNYTEEAFKDLVRTINPNVSNRQLEALYETYHEAPRVAMLVLTQMSVMAQQAGLTGGGKGGAGSGKGNKSENAKEEPENGKNNSPESNILIPDDNPEPDNLPTDSNSVKPDTLTQERIDYYLGKARQNNECDTVALGCNGTYDKIAENENYAHFKMEQTDWAALEKETGKDYEEIWKVNQQYLDEQIAANKKILLTNNPEDGYFFDDGSERFFQKELNYLDEPGYDFGIDTETNLWCAVKNK